MQGKKREALSCTAMKGLLSPHPCQQGKPWDGPAVLRIRQLMPCFKPLSPPSVALRGSTAHKKCAVSDE